MAAIGTRSTLDAGPLSIAGLQRVIDRLPAEQRARVAWTAPTIAKAITEFLSTDRGDAAFAELMNVVVAQFRMLGAVMVSLTSQPDLLRTELEEAWRADTTLLRHRSTPAAADAAAWVIRAWVAYMDASFTLMSSMREDLPELFSNADASILTMRGSPLRTQALMMAAIEAARHDYPKQVVSDLVFRAFDEAVFLLRYLQDHGIRLHPFRGETSAERAERMRRYADHIRDTLSDDDIAELHASRLGPLR